MEGTYDNISVKKKWMKLGIVLAVLQLVFLLLIVVLLRIDLYLAVAVAVGFGVVGGIVLMIFVLYVY